MYVFFKVKISTFLYILEMKDYVCKYFEVLAVILLHNTRGHPHQTTYIEKVKREAVRLMRHIIITFLSINVCLKPHVNY